MMGVLVLVCGCDDCLFVGFSFDCVWLLVVRCDGLSIMGDAVLACRCVFMSVYLIVRVVCFALCCVCVIVCLCQYCVRVCVRSVSVVRACSVSCM